MGRHQSQSYNGPLCDSRGMIHAARLHKYYHTGEQSLPLLKGATAHKERTRGIMARPVRQVNVADIWGARLLRPRQYTWRQAIDNLSSKRGARRRNRLLGYCSSHFNSCHSRTRRRTSPPPPRLSLYSRASAEKEALPRREVLAWWGSRSRLMPKQPQARKRR